MGRRIHGSCGLDWRAASAEATAAPLPTSPRWGEEQAPPPFGRMAVSMTSSGQNAGSCAVWSLPWAECQTTFTCWSSSTRRFSFRLWPRRSKAPHRMPPPTSSAPDHRSGGKPATAHSPSAIETFPEPPPTSCARKSTTPPAHSPPPSRPSRPRPPVRPHADQPRGNPAREPAFSGFRLNEPVTFSHRGGRRAPTTGRTGQHGADTGHTSVTSCAPPMAKASRQPIRGRRPGSPSSRRGSRRRRGRGGADGLWEQLRPAVLNHRRRVADVHRVGRFLRVRQAIAARRQG